MEAKITKDIIIDTLIERPISFSIGQKRFQKFTIYPITLGKSLIISNLINELGIEKEILNDSPLIEIMRVCSVNKDIAARIIAYAVCKSKEEVMDLEHVEKTARIFAKQSTEDVASLINTILSHDRTGAITEFFGIDKEIKDMRKVQEAKDGGNDMSFCGKSIWGQMIDVVCERYGWTMDYVMWGISYNNLQMLITDQVKTIFLTDEERKKVHIPPRGAKVHKAENMSVEEMKKILNIQ